jgi:glutaredoxin-dependent peroxiredoxin
MIRNVAPQKNLRNPLINPSKKDKICDLIFLYFARMKLSAGQKAPEFTLFNSDKQKVTLADLKGKNVLLLFFPQAFTGVCTKELCNVRDNIAAYNNANAQVLGISVDSVFTLKKYKEEQGLNFPLLSDFNKEVSEAYGSLYDNWIFDMKGVSKRSAFVIDKEGIIRYAEVLDNAGDLPDFERINQALSSLN